MGKRHLIQDIEKNSGFIFNDEPINVLLLLCKAYDLIEKYNLSQSHASRIGHLIGLNYKTYETAVADFRGGKLRPILPYHDYTLVWSDIYSYLSSLSPKDYYFGRHPVQQACLGWFKLS